MIHGIWDNEFLQFYAPVLWIENFERNVFVQSLREMFSMSSIQFFKPKGKDWTNLLDYLIK